MIGDDGETIYPKKMFESSYRQWRASEDATIFQIIVVDQQWTDWNVSHPHVLKLDTIDAQTLYLVTPDTSADVVIDTIERKEKLSAALKQCLTGSARIEIVYEYTEYDHEPATWGMVVNMQLSDPEDFHMLRLKLLHTGSVKTQ